MADINNELGGPISRQAQESAKTEDRHLLGRAMADARLAPSDRVAPGTDTFRRTGAMLNRRLMVIFRVSRRKHLFTLGLVLWLIVGLLGGALHASSSHASPPMEGWQTPGFLGEAPRTPSPAPTAGGQAHGRGYVPPRVDLSHLDGRWRTGADLAALASLPTQWDWRQQGAVTRVQDQGPCGACYAFGTLGSFESQLLIADASLYDLSEKHAAFCNYDAVHGTGAGGCDGGNIWMVTNLYSTQGAVLETCDPWDDGDHTCKSGCPLTKTVTEMWALAGNTPPPVDMLKNWLHDYGPLYVAVDAGGYDLWGTEFSNYDGSYTLYHPDADPSVNHAVLLVGWDDALTHDGGTGGWIVKNSWGTGWGGTCGYGSEGGYFTIAYGSAGIGSSASLVRGWQDYDANSHLLYLDDAGMQSFVGYGISTGWGLARLTPDEDGSATQVEIWTSDETTDVDVYIYDDFDGAAATNLLWSSENNTFDYAGYHSIPIQTRLPLAAGDDVNVMVKFGNAEYEYPLPVDNLGPVSANQSFVSTSGQAGHWTDLQSYDWDLGIRLRVASGGATATPTLTPTGTPTSIPSVTGEPTVPDPTATSKTPTATPTPASRSIYLPLVVKEWAAGVELIQDGGFEQGTFGPWLPYSSGEYRLIYDDVGYGGSWGAWLGGYDNARDAVGQYLTMPADAIIGGATLKVYMETNDPSPSPSDTLAVELWDAEGNTLVTFPVYDNTQTVDTWVTYESPDLAAYRGQSFFFTIYASTDATYDTSFYVDDVSLTVQVP